MAFVVVVVLGSCTGDHLTGGPTGPPREPRSTPPTAPPEGVSFDGSVERGATDDELIVRYEIVNDGDEPVVVFNRMPTTDSPNPEPGVPDQFYVVPEGGSGARISKQVFGTPQGVGMNARMVVGGATVASGDRLSERIELDRSFVPRRPYQDVLGLDTEPLDDVGSVTLCVGVAPADKVTELTYDEAPHEMYAHDDRTANQQNLFCSGPHDVGT